jgi:hypothetical protein
LIKRLDSLKFKVGGNVNTVRNVRNFSTVTCNHNNNVRNVRNFSTVTCNHNNNNNNNNKDVKLKVTEPKQKHELKSFEKILINGLIFYKSKDGLRIDYSGEIEYKKAYESVQQILQDLQKTDSKGFLNISDLNHFPVISQFINHFTFKTENRSEEAYIKGNKAADAYK